jgi:CBS domain-containing protein
MNTIADEAGTRIILRAETAADLMSPNPVSIRQETVVSEAIAFLTDKGYSAAPVIDQAGRPVGVLSRSDILVHERERGHYVPEFYQRQDLKVNAREPLPRSGFQVENVDPTTVEDIMTPAVFSVTPETPAAKVIQEMLALKVHRLFVVGPDRVLVGVISALDILRHLR